MEGRDFFSFHKSFGANGTARWSAFGCGEPWGDALSLGSRELSTSPQGSVLAASSSLNISLPVNSAFPTRSSEASLLAGLRDAAPRAPGFHSPFGLFSPPRHIPRTPPLTMTETSRVRWGWRRLGDGVKVLPLTDYQGVRGRSGKW